MEEVYQINQFAIDGRMPDLTLFFDISPRDGLARIDHNKDREKKSIRCRGLILSPTGL